MFLHPGPPAQGLFEAVAPGVGRCSPGWGTSVGRRCFVRGEVASSSISKSSGDAPTLLPASVPGGEGVAGQIGGLGGFCEDAVAGAQPRQGEVACPLRAERCPLHPSIAVAEAGGGCRQRCP